MSSKKVGFQINLIIGRFPFNLMLIEAPRFSEGPNLDGTHPHVLPQELQDTITPKCVEKLRFFGKGFMENEYFYEN